jgi:hypothetical protein
VNSFPDGTYKYFNYQFVGVAILATDSKILYVNKRLKSLFNQILNEKDVLKKLLSAKNCAK